MAKQTKVVKAKVLKPKPRVIARWRRFQIYFFGNGNWQFEEEFVTLKKAEQYIKKCSLSTSVIVQIDIPPMKY